MLVKNIEKKEDQTGVFQVEVSAEEFEKAVNDAYLKAKKDISIPGFRKGKVPRAMAEQYFGATAFYQDAIDELSSEAFVTGLEQSALKVVGKPSITNVDLSEEKVLTFDFMVELYPEVTLGEYKNLTVRKNEVVVTDEMVEAKIKAELNKLARTVEVTDRAAEMGDTANIDFEGFLDGVPFEGGKADAFDLELGSGSFVPGFEEQVAGMKLGEEKDLDITFPENYTPELAGKAVVFKVKLNFLTAKEIPELDDETVQDISEFDTVDEYKADLVEELKAEEQNKVDEAFRTNVMKAACDNMTVTVPEHMIMAKVEEFLRNYSSQLGIDPSDMSLDELMKLMQVDDENMNNYMRPAAEFQVKQELLLDAIVEAEGFEMSDEELDAYVKGAAESIGAKPEEILNYFGLPYIKNEALKEKAGRLIIETANAE